MRQPLDLSLYLVLDPGLCAGFGMVETARAAVSAGATMVQLRDKHGGTARLIETGRALKAALAGTGATLVINDDVEAAIAIGADALHIGQDDMKPEEARRRIGPDMRLGLSASRRELAAIIDPAIVDYAGIGPVFTTTTKSDHKQPIGFSGLAEIVAAAPVPTVAIGGLKADHVIDVFAAGAAGICVVSAICGQPDPAAATRLIAENIRRQRP